MRHHPRPWRHPRRHWWRGAPVVIGVPGVLGCPVLSVVSVLGVISILVVVPVVVPVVGSSRIVGTIPARRDEANGWPWPWCNCQNYGSYGFPGLDQPG